MKTFFSFFLTFRLYQCQIEFSFSEKKTGKSEENEKTEKREDKSEESKKRRRESDIE